MVVNKCFAKFGRDILDCIMYKKTRRVVMNFNATVVGQVIVIFALVVGVTSYFLGRRKTQSPILAGVLGAVLSIVPLFGLIYVVVLMLKNDVKLGAETTSH
tara:strand:+ start:2635 stop:2937 length:303 start_codon:yes stop_codon:yes gene_type:complete